jgi:hypothetical protein
MPAVGTAVGFAYFAVAKFLGYTAFCRWIIEPRLLGSVATAGQPSTLFPSETSAPKLPSAFKAGAARTVIGVAAGALAGLSFFSGIPGLEKHGELTTVIFFALLVPIRIGEWWFLFWWIYREFPVSNNIRGRLITYGIFVSFALDAVGILAAFVLPGGVWIC